MNSSQVCVDASFVVQTVIAIGDDKYSGMWNAWKDAGRRIIAPPLIHYEVTNGLYQYQRHGRLSKETIDSAAKLALSLPIELHTIKDFHTDAKRIAELYDLAATHEAHYLALAERMRAEFWTTDKRLFNTLQPFDISWINLVETGWGHP